MSKRFEITLLDEEEFKYYSDSILYRKDNLTTDFAIVLGAYSNYKNSSDYWLKNDTITTALIAQDSSTKNVSVNLEDVAIRPAFNISPIKNYLQIISLDARGDRCIFKFGEYPQYIVDDDLNIELENAFRLGKIKKTGKFYTTAGPCIDNDGYKSNREFIPYEHIEYEYEGKKYVRVANFNSHVNVFSDESEKYYELFNNIFWIEVEPIEWLYDLESDLAISQFNLLGGIKFQYLEKVIKHKNFEETSIYNFLNNYFVKEIISDKFLYDELFNSDIDYDISYNDTVSKKFK